MVIYTERELLVPMFYRRLITEAVFLAVLNYGDAIYRHASVSILTPLEWVYHCSLRVMTGDCYSTCHCILCENVVWAPFTGRHDSHWSLFFFF